MVFTKSNSEILSTESKPSIDAVTKALKGLGHEVVNLGDDRTLATRLKEENPQLVFNLGGGWGRTCAATIPVICDLESVHYSGSDGMTLALAQNKYAAKVLVASMEAPVVEGVIITELSELDHLLLPLPLFLKPLYGSDGLGIEGQPYVMYEDELYPQVSMLLQKYSQPVLVEELLEGREFVVGLWGGSNPDIISIMERKWVDNRSEPFIYTRELRENASEFVNLVCPAELRSNLATDISGIARIAWRAVGCCDLAIVDIKCNADGEPQFLEIDPLPDLTPGRGVITIMAEMMGISYRELIEGILKSALSRIQ